MSMELYGLDSLVGCLVDLIGKYSPLSDRPRDVIAIFLSMVRIGLMLIGVQLFFSLLGLWC